MANPIKFCAAFLLSLSAIAHSQEFTTITDRIAEEIPAVTSLMLIGFNDAQDLVELQSLANGQTLDLAQFNVEHLNVVADVADESMTGSVHFALSGPITLNRWENNAIFTMEVETDNLNIQEFPVGNYTLTATPYALADMEGLKGVAKTVSFTIKDSKTVGAAVPPIAAAELVAVDEATGSFHTIRRLSEGSTINIADMSFSQVNIVAISENMSKTASVLFDLDGPVQISRYENETDFTLADKSEHLNWAQGDLPEGDYTLIVTPFAEANAQGEAGVPLMLNFSIGDEDPVEEVATKSAEEPLMSGMSVLTEAASGFTAIRPSADSKRVYVSSSFGNDNNTCLSEASPCKSIKAGLEKMRDGYPDHIYLKRGDVWRNENLLSLRSGRSAEEPAVFAYYGVTGGRPKLEGSGVMLQVFQNKLANLHVLGLEFSFETFASSSTEGGSNNAVIALLGASENLLFEDNKFSNMTVVVKPWKNVHPQNIHLRRNIWVNDSATAAQPGKLHLDGIHGLLIEENVFNYSSDSATNIKKGEDALPFALTISNSSDTVTLRGNIIVGSSAHEEQLFPGAIIQNNFITEAGGTSRFNAFLDAVSSRPLGFWNVRYSSAAIDIYMLAN